MENILIKNLIPHPRNKEFFDDIESNRWKDFIDSIVRRGGVTEPVVITPKENAYMIVSGHQRVKACKEIGLLEIPCRIITYPELDEKTGRNKDDLILEDLICTNIMQRGVGNLNPMKMAKCIVELERIKGIKQGNNQYSLLNYSTSKNNIEPTQTDLAETLHIDRTQLINYKKLTNLIPELQQMVENKSLKATVGYKVWAKMSSEEQEKFFNEIGREKIKTLTQKKTQELLDKLNTKEEELKNKTNEINKLKNIQPEVIERIVEKVVTVDNTDYEKINDLQKQIDENKSEKINLQKKILLLKQKADAYEEDSNDYKKMKQEIEFLTSQKDDLGRKIQAVTDISGLVVEIEHILKNKLAPVKYSKSLLEAKDDPIVINNLNDIVSVVESWCYEMKKYIPNKNNIIEVK